jgi:hypothetical protein
MHGNLNELGHWMMSDDMTVGVTITRATGTKCERCWKVLEEVGFCSDHKDLCFRCVSVVEPSLSIYELATMRFDWLYKSYLTNGYTKEQAIQKAGHMNRING